MDVQSHYKKLHEQAGGLCCLSNSMNKRTRAEDGGTQADIQLGSSS